MENGLAAPGVSNNQSHAKMQNWPRMDLLGTQHKFIQQLLAGEKMALLHPFASQLLATGMLLEEAKPSEPLSSGFLDMAMCQNNGAKGTALDRI